ncbi:MAG TPA: 3-deoxy-8-phosphooctulonate synthase [Nitrospinota bacterium]|nr:3-deoxy-8-phosphooctulonate synthase [Nitrospinota bacterium]|tara:strand:- start:111697 stop:112533 length:837 start_codon:yes stop_codon:yes gene_type:complete
MEINLVNRSIKLAQDAPLVFIGGPCMIESRIQAIEAAKKIMEITNKLGMEFIYKSSYDKANRSSVNSSRGVGIDAGLDILAEVRDTFNIPVLTDVHSPESAIKAGAIVDVLQIPALLCRQTDLLIAAGESGKAVNVKKGQFMAPWDMANVVEKILSTGNNKVSLTERGTSFGYNNLIVDMTSLVEMAQFDVPVIFDAGHSVQRPGSLGNQSGGDRDLIPSLSRAAVAVGISALFLETHLEPDKAPCDGPNMWPIKELLPLLGSVKEIDKYAKRSFGSQ